MAVFASIAIAETTLRRNGAGVRHGGSTPKQVQRARRKAVRAKKNDEPQALKKNGNQPQSDQLNYPSTHQSAEKKAGGSTATSAPSTVGTVL